MNTGHRPHPAAPRIPLIVPVAVLFAAIFGVVYVLVTFFGGRADAWFTAPLGAPLTAVLLLATVALTSWWFLRGEVRHARLAVLAAALVLLPAAGLLGTWQGVEPAAQRYGGIAGRNLAWFMLRILETGPAFAYVTYGALLLFGLYFLKQAAAAAAEPEDASAVLARLARSRAGADAPPAEIPPPSSEEELGIPRPLGGEQELFGADAETMPAAAEAPPEENVSETAFLAAAEESEPEAPVAVEEPPPPPKRRRVFENILPEEDDRVDEDSTLIVPVGVAGAAAPVGLHELFGAGVIDAADDEDVLTPPRPAPAAEVAATAAEEAAAPPSAGEDSAEASIAPSFRAVAASEVEDAPKPPAPLAALAATAAPAGAAVAGDERESLEDAAEEPTAEREEERPLFAPPPRLLPYEDDDVGDVDDLPTDDEPSSRRMAAPLTDAVVEEPAPPAESFAFDPEITPPPSVRYDADGEGARTGETPRRALWTDEEPATPAAPAAEVQAPAAEVFPNAAAEAAPDDEAAPAKRRRARAPRAKRAEAETAAEGSAAPADAEADVPSAAPLFSAAEGSSVTEASEAETPEIVVAAEAAAESTPEAEAAPVAEAAAEAPVRRPAPSAARRPAPSAPADEFEVLTARAAEVVIGAQRCSPSLLQRELGIRFVEAAAVIERLHQRGVVGPHTPSGVREVLVRAGSAGA